MRSPLTYFLIGLLALSLLSASNVSAQSDSTSYPTDKLFRPALGLNVGMMSYFGDVGSLDGLSRSPSLNFGQSLNLVSPISKNFSLRTFALFGKITEEERIENGNANFSTTIRMGGLSLQYNFGHFLPEERWIEPYLGVGISTFEFNSKADLKDANGNIYHYWSDGTIRSIAETAPDKSSAIMLERDYSYESDLRATEEINSPYAQRGITVPLSAGANLKINDFFTLNMGTEFHVSFTDDLDNISESGRSGNDHFMYSSIGLMYNLHHRKKNKTDSEFDSDFAGLDFEDEDSDGIADILDECPFTDEGVETDSFGCPVDSDGDGVPDYRDTEPNTEMGITVDLEGAQPTDAAIENMYLTYKDSIGDLSYQKSRKTTADFEGNFIKMRDRKKGYRVVLKDTDNLTGDDISQLLSVSDFKTGTDENGAPSYYVGEFQSLEEALGRKSLLESMSYDTELIFHEFGTSTPVAQSEIDFVANSMEASTENSNQTVFRVQIGAYRYRLSNNVFNEVDDLLVITGNDGLVRYVSGSFTNIRAAAEHKIDLLLMGFEGAFVTAYRGGKRISLKEAGARVSGEENIGNQPQKGGINSDLVKYSVLLGTFEGRVPAEALGKFIELDGVRPMRGQSGTTQYVYKSFGDKQTAEKELDALKEKGFENAELIGIFNGNVISSEEADRLKND